MAIIGHGVDLVDISEVASLLRLSNDFLFRCFTGAERERLTEISASPERIAVRFAAKEAVLKSLGKSFGSGFSFQDVEVFNHVSGAPFIVLHGRTLELADSLGVTKWFVSLSHDGGQAIASVIAC